MQVDIAENSQSVFLSCFKFDAGEQRTFSQTTMMADIKILDTLEFRLENKTKYKIKKFFPRE